MSAPPSAALVYGGELIQYGRCQEDYFYLIGLRYGDDPDRASRITRLSLANPEHLRLIWDVIGTD